MIKKEGNKIISSLIRHKGHSYIIGFTNQVYKRNISDSIYMLRYVLNQKTKDRLKTKNKNVKS